MLARSGRRPGRSFKCPFHLENASRAVEGACNFQGSLLELKEHLATCSFQGEEVKTLADSQSGYFQKYPSLAGVAGDLIENLLQRLQSGIMDEEHVRLPGQAGRAVVVSGFRQTPLRQQLGTAASRSLQREDAEWQDFLELCLPGWAAPEIATGRGPHVVGDMLVVALRNDGSGDNGAKPREHSLSVWIKALAEALAEHGAPDGRQKLLESLQLLGSQEDKERTILKAFKAWDVDGNGAISQLEFAALLRAIDAKIDFDSIDTMFKAVDADNSGAIDYQELVAWLFRGSLASAESPNDRSADFTSSTLTSAFPPARRGGWMR